MKGKNGRKKTHVTSILSLVILLSFIIPYFYGSTAGATGTTYYVSPTGSDNNQGTLSNPWRTIQKAADTATQGDTLYIRGGTYHEKITLQNLQGTSNAWITFSAYNSETVTIDATGIPGTYDGIFHFQDGCSYIRITGIELKSTANHGIFLQGGEINHIRIDHCTIHDCESSAIYCYSGSQPTKYVRNVEFDYNTIYDVNNGLSYSTSSWSPQEAISFSNVQGFNIHHNTLSTYGKEGIDAKSGSNTGSIHHNTICTSLASPAFQWDYNHIGIYVDGYSRKNYDISIYCNTITGYGGSGIVIGAEHPESGGELEDISIYNNLITLTYLTNHIHFRAIDSCYNCPFKDIAISSNTIYNSGSSNSPIRIFPGAANINNLKITNNIITGTAYTLLTFQELRSTEIQGRLTLANNLYYRFGGTGHTLWKDGPDKTWGTNYIINDPKFINRNTLDLHLQSTSPAINAGSMSTAALTDFEGIARPQGTNADIGAYEYHQSNSDTTPPVLTNVQLSTSAPLDIVDGWENITCSATDDVAIEEVTLIFVNVNYQTTTHTMLHKTGTSLYYYNTTLTLSGNYTYHVSAQDTSNNGASSSPTKLSLPPNWDINNDGKCTILDKVLVSVHYGQSGTPGWIREDANNNGVINMLDLVYESNHYNEHWW